MPLGRSVWYFLERMNCGKKSAHSPKHVALFSSNPDANGSKEWEGPSFAFTPCWWLGESQLTPPFFTIIRLQLLPIPLDLQSCDSTGFQLQIVIAEASSSGLNSYQVLNLGRVQTAVVKLVNLHPLLSSKSKTYAFCQLHPLETFNTEICCSKRQNMRPNRNTPSEGAEHGFSFMSSDKRQIRDIFW